MSKELNMKNIESIDGYTLESLVGGEIRFLKSHYFKEIIVGINHHVNKYLMTY